MLHFDKEIILNCDALPSPNSLKVSFETDDFIIAVKGSSLPSAPLKGGQRSVMDILADEKPYLKSVQGRSGNEFGLLHRIDNDTRGLLLIAKTQAFYDYIQENQISGSFVKTYTAYSESFPGADSYKKMTFPFEVKSRFRSFGKNGAAVKPVFEDSGRASQKKAERRVPLNFQKEHCQKPAPAKTELKLKTVKQLRLFRLKKTVSRKPELPASRNRILESPDSLGSLVQVQG